MQSSSTIGSASYDEDSKTLTITFQSGGQYVYRGVPKSVYEGLDTAVSPGSYFATAIRGKYQSERMS